MQLRRHVLTLRCACAMVVALPAVGCTSQPTAGTSPGPPGCRAASGTACDETAVSPSVSPTVVGPPHKALQPIGHKGPVGHK